MRVAVVFKDRCQPKKCHLECMAVCPPQRTGTEVIWLDPESGKAAISEETCISCGLCLPAGVPISTARGVIPIEEVEVGDLVLTHRGRYRRVSTLHRRNFTGRLYRIKSAGQADALEVTNDHPVLAVIRQPIKYGRRLRKALGVLRWVTPDELKEGDYLVKPRITETLPRHWWDVPIQVAVSGGRYPQWAEQVVSIPICEDIARLVGYFLAEGYADDRRVTFSFHEREQAYRNDVRGIIREYFSFEGYEVQGNGHGRIVRYDSALLARVLGTLGAHCHEKRIPREFMLSSAAVRSQLMRGLWWGDGHWDRKRNSFTLSTTSPHLAYQSQETLASLGITSSMYARSMEGKRRDYHIVVMGGPSINSMAALWGVEIADKRNRFSTWSLADEEYTYIPIRKVECEPVENLPVFNLEVEEDETYVAAGHVVHNCIKKCPFDAIRIIGLPDELEEDKVHQFGRNGFRLFRLPAPKAGQVVGLLGPNGVGKTTALNILSGQLVPNLGDWEHDPTWDAALDQYAGTEVHNYLKRIADGDLRAALKPQYVDRLPRAFSGQVGELLRRVDERNRLDEVAEELSLTPFLDHDLRNISGGELQRTALAATILKDADVYFFDEPSSYLDIFQRLRVARAIQRLSQEKQVVVVEHDLAILDWLADQVYLLYGEEGTYGVVAQPRPVRTAINVYLGGYLKEENIRFRDREVRFEVHPPKEEWKAEPIVAFDALEKDLDGFHLATAAGAIRRGEVVGVVGPNATGKTTFVRMLAGELRPDRGQVKGEWRVSYKPQYISLDSPGTVQELLAARLGKLAESGHFESEVGHPLGLKGIMEKEVANLSGGEQQRVAIAVALGQEADIYLLDEPSAYLDSNQRVEAAKTIRRVTENAGKSALIVDHDVYFIDMVSDSLMVFGGEPGRRGQGEGPFPMREGMNRFLRDVGVTFRRDPDSRRPRINKPDSSLDRQQKGSGEYYYALA